MSPALQWRGRVVILYNVQRSTLWTRLMTAKPADNKRTVEGVLYARIVCNSLWSVCAAAV